MDRLTEKVFGFVQLKACGNDFCKETCAEHDEEKSCKNCHIQKAFEKLAEYEDLEEQGLLLRLPCKLGDTVYCIYERYTKCSENEQEFDEYSCQGCECLECDSHKELYVQPQKAYSLDWIVSNLKRFGKTVFLTQAEAEQKLKEMESD